MNAWSALAAVAAVAVLVASSLVPAERAGSGDPALPPADLTLWGPLGDLPPTGTLVVDSPAESYTRGEALAVRAFLEGGGRLVVVEATPAAASFVRLLDAGIDATTSAVFDPDVGDDGRFTAQATGRLGPARSVRLATSQVVLGGEAVARSSAFTWRDEDRDGLPGLHEARGAWNLAAVQPVGDGAILVLGSRSLLRDPLLGPSLLAWVQEEGPLVRDAGHAHRDDPAGSTALLAGQRPVATGLLLALAATIAAALAWRVRLRRVASRRLRGAHDRQTLELLAELGD